MADDKKIIFSMVGVSKVFPPQKQVLKNIYLSFFYGAKIGIIGLNGSGKSTLLKIIAGLDKDYQGEVVFSPGYSVGYLEQDPKLESGKTVKEIVQEGVQEIVDILKEYEEVNERFGDPEVLEDPDKMDALITRQAELQDKVTRLGRSGIPAGIAQDSLLKLVNAYKDQVKREYIFKGPNKPYAYFALFQQLNGYMIFDPLTSKEDVKCFAAVATSLNNLYPHADRSRNLYNMVIKGMKNTRAPKVTQVSVPENIVQETSIIDIALKDVKGNTRRLTDLKGKVILIDFTAYATPASGARNLALRELYDKYASRGLEIYQISLDSDEHFWKTAADNLPWICVRDPQGPYSSFVSLYGVTQLPAAFIVNRNNELSLRVDEKTNLEDAIQKYL